MSKTCAAKPNHTNSETHIMSILLRNLKLKFSIIALGLTCLHSTGAQAAKITKQTPASNIVEFVDRNYESTGWSKDELHSIFAQAEYKPRIVELMDKPGEAMPWHQYKSRVVTPARVSGGYAFMSTYAEALSRAEQAYGVPREIITAIIGVETSYGTNKGGFRVLDALSTLGFNYPRRAAFFQKELVDFLALAKQSNVDPVTMTGSYAGAIGWPQFMPSSARKLAVDFDGDGKIDLVQSPVDAIGSIAAYFKANGWVSGMLPVTQLNGEEGSNLAMPLASDEKEYFKVSHNFEVIKRYNRSNLYAMSVSLLSEQLRSPQ